MSHDKCPKCGRPYLVKNDWGKAGALYVHAFGEENGMPAKVACHVPVGFVAEAAENADIEYRRGTFSTELLPTGYDGFTAGGDWNGWAEPLFAFDVAMRIMHDYLETTERLGLEGHRAAYDQDRDVFLYREPGADWEEEFAPQDILIDGRTVKVYAVGTAVWTWEETEAHSPN